MIFGLWSWTHWVQGASGEGLGGGGPADAFPEGWMRSETHYRPWFNIDFKTVSMGLGAAKTKNGWFFCKIGGTDMPEGVTTPTPVAKPAPAPQPAPKPAKPVVLGGGTKPAPAVDVGALQPANADGSCYVNEIGVGQYLIKDVAYQSNGKGMYLMQQGDGNLVIKRASDHMFIWGLNEQPGVNYKDAAKVAHVGNRLVVFDANNKEIWGTAAPASDAAHSMFLSEDGTLMLFPKDGSDELYWTSRKTIWSFDGIGPGTDLAKGTRAYAVRELSVIPTGPDGKRLAGEHLYASRSYFMELQHDGNFVVKGARANMPYVWGLDQVQGLDRSQIDHMRMAEDGRLVALRSSKQELWSVPQSGAIPGSRLNLSQHGTLQIVSPSFDKVIWQNK